MPTCRVAINALSITNRRRYRFASLRGLCHGLSQIQTDAFCFDVILPRGADVRTEWNQVSHLRFHNIGPDGSWSRVFVGAIFFAALVA